MFITPTGLFMYNCIELFHGVKREKYIRGIIFIWSPVQNKFIDFSDWDIPDDFLLGDFE